MGFDAPERTAPWVEREEFPFEIWTDQEKTLALYYGAATQSSSVPNRITKILDAEGTLILEYENIGFGIATHPAQVLNDCQLLFGEQ